jgi:hypothetical protein
MRGDVKRRSSNARHKAPTAPALFTPPPRATQKTNRIWAKKGNWGLLASPRQLMNIWNLIHTEFFGLF